MQTICITFLLFAQLLLVEAIDPSHGGDIQSRHNSRHYVDEYQLLYNHHREYRAVGEACLNDYNEAGVCRYVCNDYEDHDGATDICQPNTYCCVNKCGQCFSKDGKRGTCRTVCYNHETRSKDELCGLDYCCIDETECSVKGVEGTGRCQHSCNPKRATGYESKDCYGDKLCCMRQKRDTKECQVQQDGGQWKGMCKSSCGSDEKGYPGEGCDRGEKCCSKPKKKEDCEVNHDGGKWKGKCKSSCGRDEKGHSGEYCDGREQCCVKHKNDDKCRVKHDGGYWSGACKGTCGHKEDTYSDDNCGKHKHCCVKHERDTKECEVPQDGGQWKGVCKRSCDSDETGATAEGCDKGEKCCSKPETSDECKVNDDSGHWTGTCKSSCGRGEKKYTGDSCGGSKQCCVKQESKCRDGTGECRPECKEDERNHGTHDSCGEYKCCVPKSENLLKGECRLNATDEVIGKCKGNCFFFGENTYLSDDCQHDYKCCIDKQKCDKGNGECRIICSEGERSENGENSCGKLTCCVPLPL